MRGSVVPAAVRAATLVFACFHTVASIPVLHFVAHAKALSSNDDLLEMEAIAIPLRLGDLA